MAALVKTLSIGATIHEGGAGRAFPNHAVVRRGVDTRSNPKVIQYLRQQCSNRNGRCELNFRAPGDRKRFLRTSGSRQLINTNGIGNVSTALIWEKRFGKKNQLEFAAPFNFLERENGGWVGGIGDLVLGYKRNVMA